ncbi:MAG: 7-carboxy-7-deazaguanine synthase [Pseudomonadota bacterium]
MTYAVKEIFLTLQGEGVHTGRRAVFLRFSGCNLWSGREQDRSTAVCRFCDTDFVGTDGEGGGKFRTAEVLAAAVTASWGDVTGGTRYVVITGGEPLLQLDAALVNALHAHGFEIGVETNGTITAPPGIDWLCVSPKAGSETIQRSGNELKLVWPQPGSEVAAMSGWAFDHFLIQPMDGPELEENRVASIAFILANPKWRLSTQTHKVLGIA